MKQKQRSIFFFFLYISYLSTANTNPFPEGYGDFFEKTEEDIAVMIQGVASSVSVKATVNFDSFQLPEQSQSALSNYLQGQNLNDEAIGGILSQLKEGIAANPNCSGELTKCIPEDVPNEAEFIFDYDSQELRIFIASEMLTDASNKKEYHSAVQNDVSLINQSKLDLYASNHNQSINWQNATLIGLPYGYLDIDTTYKFNNNGQEFELNNALYNYEYNNLRFLLGYQTNASTSLNSADFLVSGANTSGFSSSIGSSYNLLKGSQQAMQRLIFYVPQSGRLEVYRNERLVLARSIGSGEQSIGYDELPNGTYTIKVRVKQSDDNVLFENQYLIVNDSNFSLPVGRWDYRIDLGQLERDENDPTSEEQFYFRSLFAYRPTERILAAAGVATNAEDAQLLFGSKLSLPYDIELSYNLGLFNSGDFYHTGSLNIAPFSFGMRSFKHANLHQLNPFVQSLYGSDNLNEFTASLYTDLPLGRSTLSYSYYDAENIESAYSTRSLSLSWFHNLFGGNFSLNLTASSSNNLEDEFTASFNWARDFGQDSYLRLGVDFDKDGYLQSATNLSHNHNAENWRASAQLDVFHHQSNGFSANSSASLSGKNDYLDFDLYGFASTKDSYSISTNLSNTQMLSSKGGALTSKQGKAFIEFDPKWEGDDSKESTQEVNYSIKSSGKQSPPTSVSRGKSSVSTIRTYQDINYELDKDFSGVDAENASGAFFSTPGTYRKVQSKILALSSQLFVFNDKDGNTIDKVECIGEGCRSVEELADDAIFRISFLQNQKFELVSNGLICQFDPKDLGKKFISSTCIPREKEAPFTPKIAALASQATTPRATTQIKPKHEAENGVNMILIGKYDAIKANGISFRLTQAGFRTKLLKSDDGYNLYIRHQPIFSIHQIELIQELNNRIRLNKLNPNLIFLMREE